MENIFWKGISNDERHAAIAKIQHVVSKYGHVVDFHFFSDISLSMTIEIEELKIDNLYDQLNEIIDIQKLDHLNSSSNKERIVYLNISFTRGSGNLKKRNTVRTGLTV